MSIFDDLSRNLGTDAFNVNLASQKHITYSPQTTSVNVPVTSNLSINAPTTNNSYQNTRTFSPIYDYSPQYIINSPNASQSTKKEFTGATTNPSQAVSLIPSISASQIPTVSPTVSPSQTTSPGSGFDVGSNSSLLMLVVVGGAALVLYGLVSKK